MKNKPVSHWMKTGGLQKQILLMGILALLIIPQLVSGGTTGTADIIGNIIQAPVARFTANITGGIAPLVVQFTDLSDRDPSSWNWEFGDGITSTLRNPTHTYASGIYTVNLTVSNAAGNSTRVSFHYITVLPAQAGSPQSPSSSPGGSSGGGFQVPGRLSPPAQVVVPEQNPPGGVQRAPVQISQGSPTIDLSPYSQFMYTDPSCRPYAIIQRILAERTGAIISVSGKTIQIIRPDFTLSITAASITETDGIIRADNIQSILIVSAPFEADINGVGRVTSSFTADIASWPSDAWLTVTFDDPVNPVVAETFQRAVAHEGGEIQAIAYTLTVQKTNMVSTACSCSYSLGVYTLNIQKTDSTAIHSATITMSAPAEWVNAHGGINAIVIGRIGDDQKCTILKTSFSGYDPNGNMKFVAESPEGLSVFGLIATRTPLQSPGTNGMFNPVGGFGFAILVLLIVMLITGYLIWRKRRTQRKDTSPPAEKSNNLLKR